MHLGILELVEEQLNFASLEGRNGQHQFEGLRGFGYRFAHVVDSLTGGPFDGSDYDVSTNFKSTLHISDPSKLLVHPDPRVPEEVAFRYRPSPRETHDGRVVYEFVLPKANNFRQLGTCYSAQVLPSPAIPELRTHTDSRKLT